MVENEINKKCLEKDERKLMDKSLMQKMSRRRENILRKWRKALTKKWKNRKRRTNFLDCYWRAYGEHLRYDRIKSNAT